MLARTFKSYRQLGIRKKEYDALIQTLYLLERGEIAYVKNGHQQSVKSVFPYPVDTQIRIFNMSIAGEKHKKCGTIGCIGGWAAVCMGAKTTHEMSDYVGAGRSDSLEPLFYPENNSGCIKYDPITPSQAAQAITNFLTTGNPDWRNIDGVKLY